MAPVDDEVPEAKPADPVISLTTKPRVECVVAEENLAELLAMVSLRAGEMTEAQEAARAPVEIVFVIDKSGSMSGRKLRDVKSCLEFALSELRERDRVAIVSYDSTVKTLAPLTAATDDAKRSLTAKVQALHSGTCTNLSGGLLRGVEQLAAAGPAAGAVRAVVLLTDGLANEGIRETPALCKALRSALAQVVGETKPSVFTMGLGSDHNEEMLRALSEAGNGSYFYLENADTIPSAFGDILGGLQSVMAQNISVAIEPVGGAALSGDVLTKFQTEKTPGGGVKIQLNDMYSEESRDLLFKLAVPPFFSAADGGSVTHTLANVTLTYMDALSNEIVKELAAVAVNRPTRAALAALRAEAGGRMPAGFSTEADGEVEVQFARVITAQRLESARAMAEKGDLRGGCAATEGATATITNMLSAAQLKDARVEALLADLRDATTSMQSRELYSGYGRMKMASKAQEHYMQRSNMAEMASAYDDCDDLCEEGMTLNSFSVKRAGTAYRSKAKQKKVMNAVFALRSRSANAAPSSAGPKKLKKKQMPTIKSGSSGFFSSIFGASD